VRLKSAIIFYPAIFANPKENKAVDGALYREVKFARGELFIANSDITCKDIAPIFDFGEKCVVYFGSAFFRFGGFRIFVKRALEYRFF
jgi:hypothetical protein